MVRIVVKGLDAIQARYKRFPKVFDEVMKATLEASLIELQGSVPPYPPEPVDSTYDRTGTLGRSLGASMQGKPQGKPDIFEVKKQGGRWRGTFGTRVSYARPVIAEKQAEAHKGRWWTIMTVAKRAKPKIRRRFQQAAERLAKWLAGKR